MGLLYNLFQRPPGHVDPSRKEERAASSHDNTRKYLQLFEASMLDVRDECSTDRVTRQRGEGDDRKEGSVADTHLTDVRDLGDESRG